MKRVTVCHLEAHQNILDLFRYLEFYHRYWTEEIGTEPIHELKLQPELELN